MSTVIKLWRWNNITTVHFKNIKYIIKAARSIINKVLAISNSNISKFIECIIFNDRVYNETPHICQMFNKHLSRIAKKKYRNPYEYLTSASPSIPTEFGIKQSFFLFLPTAETEI